MNHFLPNWMFAAFAIGGWEAFNYLSNWTGISQIKWASWKIVAICVLVLVFRYVARWIYRLRHKEKPESPDDWKKY